MSVDLAGVVLAAGAGTRLVPLTRERPKALCPVGNRPLVDRALDHLAAVTDAVAVNAHTAQHELIAHLERQRRVHVSVETPTILGTGGALARLRPWIDDRAVCLVNADAVHAADLAAFVDQWDGDRIAFLLAGADRFASGVRLCAVLMPGRSLSTLVDDGSTYSIYGAVWRPAADATGVSAVRYDGPWFDCGTPRSYLAANLWASRGASVIGEGAVVDGEVERSVIWPNAKVHKAERLVDAIRTTGGRTVLVRPRGHAPIA